MLKHWSVIEADFIREYDINLVTDLRGMSWRKFRTLLKGLSQNSVWVNICSNDKNMEIEEDQEIDEEELRKAERLVNRVW